MRVKTIAAVISLACIVGSTQVRAQSTYGDNCAELDDTDDNYISACAKSLINHQSLINTSTTVNDVILDRFGIGPNQTEPAGLELSDPAAVLERLSGNGAITIAPAADVAAPAASLLWNFWIDGKYSWLDDDDAFTNLDGSLVNAVIGADYKFGDRLVVGLLGTFESSDLEGSVPIGQQTEGWGGGVYLGYSLTDNLVFSANVLGTALDTTVINFGTTNYDSERLQTSEALTGYFYSSTWRFSPALTFAWSKEWQDAGGVINSQIIETASISPGIQVGNTLSLGGATTVEPWLGAQLDWVPVNKVVDDGLGTILDDDYTDLRLQSGLNFAFGASAQLALTGEISGLLLKDSDTYTAGANFAFQF